MFKPLITGCDLEDQFGWPAGKADRLAKRGKIPHVRLPNGDIRFTEEQRQQMLDVRDVPNDQLAAGVKRG